MDRAGKKAAKKKSSPGKVESSRPGELERLRRQLEVEAALDVIREKTLQWSRSEELADTSALLFQQLKELNIHTLRTSLGIFDDANEAIELWLTTSDKGGVLKILDYVNLHIHPVFEAQLVARKTKKPFSHTTLTGREVKDYYTQMSTYLSLPKQNAFSPEEHIYSFFFTQGSINVVVATSLTDEECKIMMRFAGVFGLVYTRFLDLQKAEAQSREARIDLSLERVRARTMAMQQSEELQELIGIVMEQFQELEMPVDFANFNFHTRSRDWTMWLARPGFAYPDKIVLPYLPHPMFDGPREAIKRGEKFFSDVLTPEDGRTAMEHFYRHAAGFSDPPEFKARVKKADGLARSMDFGTHISLAISRFDGIPYSDNQNAILRRFARVFEQAYTRFLDLQKAEAQAKEAQIEAALERVRAQTMAMHSSEDVGKCVVKMFAELTALGVDEDTRFGIGILNHVNEDIQLWTAKKDGEDVSMHIGHLDMGSHPLLKSARKAWKEQVPFHKYELEGEDLLEYYRMLNTAPGYKIQIPSEKLPKKEIQHCIIFEHGFFYAFTPYEFQPDLLQLTKRFSSLFEQTYRRYLDLVKAEAQAREARIEAALERVRNKALAMHKSNDLADVVFSLYTELTLLDFGLHQILLSIYDVNNRVIEWWSRGFVEQGLPQCYLIPLIDHPFSNLLLKEWQSGAETWSYHLKGEVKTSWEEYLFTKTDLRDFPEEIKTIMRSLESVWLSDAFMKHGSLQAAGPTPLAEDKVQVLKRFAKVVDLAYTRMLDLQNAEEQAREARIEASLERVRSKAMSMHSSQDLASTIGVFYRELETLNLTPRRCGVGLLNKDNRIAELSVMSQGPDGATVEVIGSAIMEGHPVLEQVYENWQTQQEFHPVLRGNEIKKYNQALRPQIPIPDLPAEAVMYGYFFYFPEGGVYAYTDKELAEEELKVYRRCTSVLSLTYKRYKDLKDAEARAQLAVREASLDRVRAEIASMRTADDLQRITPLVWRELKTLGVPFFRCGVLIVNEQNQRADYYLSTPEGQPLAALHLDFNTNLQVVQAALQHWREQKVYTEHWNKEQFVAFARSMMELGQIQTMRSYQGGDQPPEFIALQFIPFKQGMLYVGTAEELKEEQIDLVRSLADAFSTAYARYEDFTKLEAAKAQVDQALAELRTTQTQLIQSEKMASLGELTAGIAHEIQNPLNFVNNFSDVTKELIDEMEQELAKGNAKDAFDIAKDVIQNLEKISFHGKRADAIVKSMLQHSRKSTGQKEATDINALCDEYLRLAYHGLRAKDKSFNAKFGTNFDLQVGSLMVLPQEIGRVILNLINNAFYAVSEKLKAKSQNPDDAYEPTVLVSTKKLGNKIEISVQDNGNGIPAHIKDKIFQPFFTTKPTGQGTGLGLSLSYDIVTKSHGGELSVKTEEGAGSTFSITLPA